MQREAIEDERLKLVLLYRFSSGYMRVLVVGCDYILFLFGGGDFFFCFPLMAIVISQFPCLKLVLVGDLLIVCYILDSGKSFH